MSILLVIGVAYVGLRVSNVWPFQASLHQPTADARPWYEIGTQALRDGSYYQASQFLEKAIQKDPQFILARARLAEAQAKLDDSDEAQKQLLLVSSLVPDRSRLPVLDRLLLEAILNTTTRNLSAAIANYTEMVNLAPDSEKPRVFLDLGRVYEESDEPEKAIESYLKVLERDPQSAAAHLRLGVIYGQREKDLDKAKGSFKSAEDLYQSANNNNQEGLAEVFYNRGMVYDALNRLDEARSQLKRAAEIGNPYQSIKAILQLSGNSLSAGKLDQAQKEAEQGLKQAQNNNMKNVKTQGFMAMAYVFHSRGDFSEAEKYYTQAIESARSYNGHYNTALAQANLGGLLIQQGRLDDGLREVGLAHTFFHSAGYRTEELQSLIMIARARRKQGNYEAAQAAYEQQLPLAEKSGDQATVALIHSEIGRLLIYQERYPEVIPHINENYRINQSLGLKPKIGYVLTNRAFVMWQLGDYATARAAINEALAIADQTLGSDKQLLAEISILESRMALSEDKYKLAIQKSQEAARQSGGQFPEISLPALLTQGLAESLSGYAHAGTQHCQEAVKKAESLADDRLLADALLALAQSRAQAGQWQESLTAAQQAQELFSRRGRIESEWRTWLMIARANLSLRQTVQARDSALKASEKMNLLQQQWGADAYNRYLTRADIKTQYYKLREMLSQ